MPHPKTNHSRKISVVIPTIGLNIDELKEALNQQTLQAQEIIVIIDKGRKGASWSRNQGICKAKSDYIAFIDDDCIPPRDWLEQLLNGLKKYDADIAGGTYCEHDSLLKDLRKKRNFPDKLGIDIDGGVGAGGNIMYTRNILEKCKLGEGLYFDENFRISQDYELLWRAVSKEAKVVFVPVYPLHLKTVNFKQYLKMQFNRGRGIGLLFRAINKRANPIKPNHASMIWKNEEAMKIWDWIKVFVIKIFGPFDIHQFSSKRNFFYYWLGEKIKSFGFLYQRLKS